MPVKQDHVKLLQSALIPLHKVKCMQMYHAHLVYCMAQYIEKEQRFAVPIINGVLKFYPFGNTAKELLFLEELQELVEVLAPQTLAEVEVPIYQRLAQCIDDPQCGKSGVYWSWNGSAKQFAINAKKYGAGGSGGEIFENEFSGMVNDQQKRDLCWEYSMEAVKDYL